MNIQNKVDTDLYNGMKFKEIVNKYSGEHSKKEVSKLIKTSIIRKVPINFKEATLALAIIQFIFSIVFIIINKLDTIIEVAVSLLFTIPIAAYYLAIYFLFSKSNNIKHKKILVHLTTLATFVLVIVEVLSRIAMDMNSIPFMLIIALIIFIGCSFNFKKFEDFVKQNKDTV